MADEREGQPPVDLRRGNTRSVPFDVFERIRATHGLRT